MFCKKVNIPYEVFAFAQVESYNGGYVNGFNAGDIKLTPFRLNNLLSSRMSATEFTYAASALVNMSMLKYGRPDWLAMGGTPLNEAIVAAFELIPNFQKKYKLQVVNTVFLTDGDGHTVSEYYFHNDQGQQVSKQLSLHSWDDVVRRVVITDPVTKVQEHIKTLNGKTQTSALIKMLKHRANCNVLGFFIVSGRDFYRYGQEFYPPGIDFSAIKAEFRKNKYQVVTKAGFDEYYILRSEGLDTEDDEGFVVNKNATTRGLVSAFSKYAGNRVNNRVVLNRFIGMIA
jgi:hypothetical protein